MHLCRLVLTFPPPMELAMLPPFTAFVVQKALPGVWLPTLRTQSCLQTQPTLCFSHNDMLLAVCVCCVAGKLASDCVSVPVKRVIWEVRIFQFYTCRSLNFNLFV